MATLRAVWKKKASCPLGRLLLCVVENSVRVSVDVALVTLTCAVLMGLLGQVWTVVLERAGAVCSFVAVCVLMPNCS